MASASETRRQRETIGLRIKELLQEGYTLEQVAKLEGLTAKTCTAYAALASAPESVRIFYRDGRLPLEVIAMITECELAAGTQRRLAELYIREKAERPRFQPVDFKLFIQEFIVQLAMQPPAMTQTLLLNGEEDQMESTAFERAEKVMTRQRRIDLEQRIAEGLKLMNDPEIGKYIAARLEVIPGWTREVKHE